MTCRSDVSPSRMKVLKHENNTKFALRGFMILEMDKGRMGRNFELNFSKIDTTELTEMDLYREHYRRYKNKNDFKNRPSDFLEYAKGLCLKIC